jgi:multicomponent Na+:H+ antiporter subunit E
MGQENSGETKGRNIGKLRGSLRLLLAYSLLWLVLAGAHPSSLVIGVPAIILAYIISVRLWPDFFSAISPAGFLLFVPFFITLSVKSGIDVMLRTFSPGPRINPGIITYRTALTGSARVLFANVISLMPGTLSADLQEDEITVHVLDTDMPAEESIRKLEQRVGDVFLQRTGGKK